MDGGLKERPPPRAVGETLRARPHGRRLSDKILMAVHHACDQRDFEAAKGLLLALERILTRPGHNPDRRKDTDRLVQAYERLWTLHHQELRD